MRWDRGILNGHGDGRGLRVLHLIATSWHVKMVNEVRWFYLGEWPFIVDLPIKNCDFL